MVEVPSKIVLDLIASCNENPDGAIRRRIWTIGWENTDQSPDEHTTHLLGYQCLGGTSGGSDKLFLFVLPFRCASLSRQMLVSS
jgi:hypothetical protein